MKKNLLFVYLLLICGIIFAQPFPAGGMKAKDKVPFMPKAKMGVLKNGLTYYVLENKMPAGRAFINLAVNAGSVLEEENERGLAHFVEHMAFNGTARFPESALIDYMRSLGMRFGADLNAYTSYDETVYTIETPTETGADGKKIIPRKALEIFDDWTYTILFNEKDVDDERNVILEEKRTRSGVSERLQEVYFPLLFAGSRYAERSPIGLEEVITGAPAARLKAFYEKWYRPDNMAVIIAGDFDAESLAASLEDLFTAPVPPKKPVRPAIKLPEPKKNNIAAKVWTDSELTSRLVYIHYKQKWSEPGGDFATYRRRIQDSLIRHIVSERFDELVLQPQSPFTSAGASLSHPTNMSEFYTFMASAKDGRIEDSLAALIREKESVMRYGFVEGELDRAKKSLLTSFDRFYNERDKRASSRYIDEFLDHFLRKIEAPGIEWEYAAVQHLLREINVKDLAARAKEYFAYNDVIVFITAPVSEETSLPSEDAVKTLVRSAPSLVIEKPSDSFDDGSFLTKEPSQGAVIAEKPEEASGTTSLELSNGARIILRPTDNKDDDITLYAIARGGTANVPERDVMPARFAADIMAGSGMGKWKINALSKKLSGTAASLSFSTASFTRTFQGNANRAGLETMFQMLYLSFTEPRIDEDALLIVKDMWKAHLLTRAENPENVFSDELTKILYGGSPHFMPITVDDISKINISVARNFIESALNPTDWTFVFTGNINTNTLKPLIETYISSIPVKNKTVYRLDRYPDIEIKRPGTERRELHKGKDNKSLVYISRIVPKQFSITTALAANVLTDYLDIILNERIREKLGGVYSISANVGLSPIPPRKPPNNTEGAQYGEMAMEISFVCDPKRVEELTAAVDTAVKEIADGDVNADSFKKARYALIRGLEESLQSNVYVARILANYSRLFNLDLKVVYERDTLYAAIQESDIQEIMRCLLQADELKMIMYPEGQGPF
ncbi:MAG: insulinase family protein [Spirochaetaceae bacterium]|jgi:zinc protease|nr:insulinase family protein [Spirochaetaceae bacterium]